MEASLKMVSGKEVRYIEHNGYKFAETTLIVLGRPFIVRVSIVRGSEDAMATHVFGFNSNFVDSNGKNLYEIITKFHNRSGSYTNFYGEGFSAISFQVGNYIKSLKKWIPHMERELNNVFGGTYTTKAVDKMANEHIAIIGLGGTGMRIAELMGKTIVKSFVLVDPDKIEGSNVHKMPISNSDIGISKVELAKKMIIYADDVQAYCNKYEDVSHMITSDNITFAFIAIDDNEARERIKTDLKTKGIDFIDSGIWIAKSHDDSYRFASRSSWPEDEEIVATSDDGEYKNNNQIAEINSLAAAQAVILYKTKKKFYKCVDDIPARHKIENNLVTTADR